MAFLEVTQPSSSLLTLSQAVSGRATVLCVRWLQQGLGPLDPCTST